MSTYRLRADVLRKAAADKGDASVNRIIARTGLPRSVVQRSLGGYTEPSLNTVMRFHAIYEVPVHELVTELDDETAEATG